MTKAQQTAHRFRRLILIGGILYTVAALWWMTLPLYDGLSLPLWGDDFEPAGLVGAPLPMNLVEDRWGYGASVVFFLGLLLLAEWAFLRPGRSWMMRQRECYCARGTYTTLVFAGTVLLWAFGPGIIFLCAREKYHRARLHPMCRNCAYNLTGNTSGICPECGTRINEA